MALMVQAEVIASNRRKVVCLAGVRVREVAGQQDSLLLQFDDVGVLDDVGIIL